MRRILQASGAEVVHLGHNRSVEEVVNAAIQEDVQGIAISSYQGGHVEYFKYMYDLLEEKETQIKNLRNFQERNGEACVAALQQLKEVAVSDGNSEIC